MNIDQEIDRWIKTSASNIVVYVNNPGEFASLADAKDAHIIQTNAKKNIAVNLITPNGLSTTPTAVSNNIGGNRNIVELGGVTVDNVIKYNELPTVMYFSYNGELLRFTGKNPNFTVNFQNIDGGVVRLQLRELTGLVNSTRADFNNAAVQNAQNKAAPGDTQDYDTTGIAGNPLYSLRVRPSNVLLADMAARFQAKMTPADYNRFMGGVQRGGTLLPGTVNTNTNTASVSFVLGGKKFAREYPTNQLVITNGTHSGQTLDVFLQTEKANLDKYREQLQNTQQKPVQNLINKGKNLLDFRGNNRYANIEKWI